MHRMLSRLIPSGVSLLQPAFSTPPDNLNTRRKAPLYETFPTDEARRIARKLEFYHTPMHGSWLNMAEIEFSILSRCCLGQRLPDVETLRREVHALEWEQNEAHAAYPQLFNRLLTGGLFGWQ